MFFFRLHLEIYDSVTEKETLVCLGNGKRRWCTQRNLMGARAGRIWNKDKLIASKPQLSLMSPNLHRLMACSFPLAYGVPGRQAAPNPEA